MQILTPFKKAFTLIEVLVATLISTILIFITAKIGVYFYTINSKNNEQNLLQQHTHQLLDLLSYHIQNIQFQGSERAYSNFSLFSKNGKNYSIEDQDHCLVFFTDTNQDGCVGQGKVLRTVKKDHQTFKYLNCVDDSNQNNTVQNTLGEEIFGFKFENGEIKNLIGMNVEYNRCSKEKCQQLLESCTSKDGRKWKIFTNNDHYTVKNLQFKWLKPDKLMQVNLALQSKITPEISYEASSQIYLLNSKN